jgi:hypothetical protein
MRRLALLCTALAVVPILLLTASTAAAAPAVTIGQVGEEPIGIGSTVDAYVDGSGMLGPEEIQKMGPSAFQTTGGPHPNFGFTRRAVWYRFVLTNASSGDLQLILDASRAWTDWVDLFAVVPTGIERLGRSGAKVRLTDRPVKSEDIAFPIELKRGETRTFLLREQGSAPIAFVAQLWSRNAYQDHEARENLAFGGYYAVLLGLAAYSLLLYTSLRDRPQLQAGTMLAFYAFGEACAHGHVSRFLPFGAGWLEISGSALCFAVSVAMLLAWTNYHLPVSEMLAGKERWLRAFAVAVVAATAAPALAPRLYFLTYTGLGLVAVAVMGVSIASLRTRARAAKYFFVASGALTAPGTVTLAVLFGVLPAYGAAEYGNHVGAVVMGCLFSLLVADTIRADRSRVAELNVELETQLGETRRHAKEVADLNEELRFQVAARSKELVDVLAKHEGPIQGRALDIGEAFENRYRVRRKLGSGAWGVVYEVERMSDGRPLALKLVTRARTGIDAARVAREAEIGATMQHPNLVQIVDVGVSSGGCPFLAMELVHGGSLEGARDRFGDAAWAMPLLRQIAQGLCALHASKIVHRDVKPANVLLSRETDTLIAKLADFGIARPEVEQASPPDPLAATVGAADSGPKQALTATGALIGTPLYMPPEAGHQSTVGPPGDVFALGVMAYEMLTRTLPFEGVPVYVALAGEALPPPRRLDVESDRLRACIEACVEVDPSRRPTATQVLSALASELEIGATLRA